MHELITSELKVIKIHSFANSWIKQKSQKQLKKIVHLLGYFYITLQKKTTTEQLYLNIESVFC